MTGEIIENTHLRKRHNVDGGSTPKRSSILPDWTDIGSTSADDSQCVCPGVKCITLSDFYLMVGTILIGILMSLGMLYIAILVSQAQCSLLSIQCMFVQVLDTDDMEEDLQDKFGRQLVFWLMQTKLHKEAKLHDQNHPFQKRSD